MLRELAQQVLLPPSTSLGPSSIPLNSILGVSIMADVVWGLTSPLGVHMHLTFALSALCTPMPIALFLKVFGMALTGLLVLIWVYVGGRMAVLAMGGSVVWAALLVEGEEVLVQDDVLREEMMHVGERTREGLDLA
ncbi:hypothetical protein DACRYDRAFT_109858 [Dacryopinax primogenitus]|uniref:Uncharacterized protein n=1 Tax=Dacryopinax primogenitus (strain DJM 731) TaxID=1858805 RepID=M5FU89_DACPD|nr:uncharacterized protein DACRYDRAFT_109858 [Dacryopinax primogenitus]EJT99753.1 hypothetical protein DACRYDRAFT_109858 [Dacryopinax primogenitus]